MLYLLSSAVEMTHQECGKGRLSRGTVPRAWTHRRTQTRDFMHLAGNHGLWTVCKPIKPYRLCPDPMSEKVPSSGLLFQRTMATSLTLVHTGWPNNDSWAQRLMHAQSYTVGDTAVLVS